MSVAGGAGTFSVDDVAVREGQTFTFTVRRSSGTGTATVHWSVRDVGSAVRGQDYPAQNGGFAMAGDLAFAAGETSKTVTSIWTLDEGAPEPDETFQFHLSHPTNMRIARPTATATILNDDTIVETVTPNVLGDDGPRTVTLRGTGLTSQSTVLLRHGGRPDIAPVSYVPSDDGLSAVAVFDTTGPRRWTGTGTSRRASTSSAAATRFVNLQHAGVDARPFVQASGPAFARGGLPTYDYLTFGNLGSSPSRPAFVRLSGYPTGADLVVDHLPPGATAGVLRRREGPHRRGVAGQDPGEGQRLRARQVRADDDHPRPHAAQAAGRDDFSDPIPAMTDGRTLTGRRCCRRARVS